MNLAEAPATTLAAHTQETALRRALTNMTKEQKVAVLRAGDWKDESSISKVLTGNAGIPLDALDQVLGILGLTIVEIDYMNYLAKGNSIGAFCCRARMSQGHCTGPR